MHFVAKRFFFFKAEEKFVVNLYPAFYGCAMAISSIFKHLNISSEPPFFLIFWGMLLCGMLCRT